jgi:hypothetical protein
MSYSILETVDDKYCNTYSLNNIRDDEKQVLMRYIKYNLKITQVRIDNRKWYRILPKTVYSKEIENKLKTMSAAYANRNILAGDIFWVLVEMPDDSLTLELHTTKSMTIDEYRDKCFLEGITKVISDEEFYAGLFS